MFWVLFLCVCYTFISFLKYIWNNLLTRCTQCQFLSGDVCELQVYTHIYSGQKIPTKKNQRNGRLQKPEEEPEGGHPSPTTQGGAADTEWQLSSLVTPSGRFDVV